MVNKLSYMLILAVFVSVSIFGYAYREYSLYQKRQNPEYWYQLGAESLESGQKARFEKALQQALALNPRYKPALLLMAMYTHQQGDILRSQAYFRRLRETYPADSSVYSKLTELLDQRQP